MAEASEIMVRKFLKWLESSAPMLDPDGVTPKLYRHPDGAVQPFDLFSGLDAEQARRVRTFVESKGYEATELSTHNDAKVKLQNSLRDGHPFVLFLRSYSLEVSAYPAMRIAQLNEIRRHRRIRALFAAAPPFIGLRNDMDRGSAAFFPTLDVPNEIWTHVVKALIILAPVMVVRIQNRSPSVLVETAWIVERGKQNAAIVFVAKPMGEGEIRFLKTAGKMSDFLGFPPTHIDEPIDSDDIRHIRSYGFTVIEEKDLEKNEDAVKLQVDGVMKTALKNWSRSASTSGEQDLPC